MSTPFYNASMCKRFSWRLALAFCFLSLASSAAPVDDIAADTADIATHQMHIDSTTAAIESYVQGVSALQAQDSVNWNTFRQHIESYLNNTGPSGSIGKEFDRLSIFIRQFLSGANSDSWYSGYPQFRFMSGGTKSPPDSLIGQNLTYFLTYALGQNIQWSPVAQAFDWDYHFTTNATFEGVTSKTSLQKLGYSVFNVWLAEAMRRQIYNTTNLVTSDWRTLNGSTNPVQAVSAAVTDEQLANSSFSNSVAAIDQQLEDMRPEEAGTPTGYDNTEDFSSASSLIGPDDGETSWSPAILLATSSQVSDIASAAGIQAASLPTIEFSPYSHSSISSGINRLSTAMVSVWNWVRSLAVLGIVIYWYRKCRGLATAIYCGNRRAG